MPLSIPQLILGTQVAITHAEDGETRLPVERRGVIWQVDTVKEWSVDPATKKRTVIKTMKNGNPATGVHKIWVLLKKGEKPVEVKNCQLTLIHEANRKAFDEIKRAQAVEEARELEAKSTVQSAPLPEPQEGDIPIVIPEEPIVVQELGVPEGRGLTAAEIMALESGEPLPEEPPKKLQRVMPKGPKE